jgi:DNA invertase Pin-like site-specific DNA recombinase
MNYGYIRVSSDKQTVENQRFEIQRFCKQEGLSVDGWIEETVSGTKNYDKRELGTLLDKVQKDDLIICSELSRLGRSLFMIMEILNHCMDKECRVWTIKDSYRLGDDIQSKVLAFAFGLSAEIERNLISQRTKEALARKEALSLFLWDEPFLTVSEVLCPRSSTGALCSPCICTPGGPWEHRRGAHGLGTAFSIRSACTDFWMHP